MRCTGGSAVNPDEPKNRLKMSSNEPSEPGQFAGDVVNFVFCHGVSLLDGSNDGAYLREQGEQRRTDRRAFYNHLDRQFERHQEN
uniref:hypothetical protein n=1 Tax=Nocardia wallacei TaxID=480035 RepID=UPI0024544DE5